MNIGGKIHQARKAKGMTMEELGQIIGVGKSAVSKYESGVVTEIPPGKIEAIANALDVAPSYLVGWTGQPDLPDTGSIIQSRRKELGISVDALAKKLGMERSTLYRYESGDTGKIPFGVVVLLSDALSISLDELAGIKPRKARSSDGVNDLETRLSKIESRLSVLEAKT
jgi:transcriptional regulator with XRE-family HTH domain